MRFGLFGGASAPRSPDGEPGRGFWEYIETSVEAERPPPSGHVRKGRQDLILLVDDEAAIREHARLGGFPANRISRVFSIIDPSTAE